MEIAFIVVAFLLGFAAAEIRLPPLVGYLVAGFVLHAFGYESTEAIDIIAELGVLLLLFGKVLSHAVCIGRFPAAAKG